MSEVAKLHDPEVERIVKSFAPQSREIFQRHYRHNQSYDVIAEEMHLTKHDVKVSIAAMLYEVQQRLGKAGALR